VVCIKQAKDRLVSRPAVAVFENLNVRIFGNRSLNALGELDRPVMRIVVAHEAANEADHNVGGDRGRVSFDSTFGHGEGRSGERQKQYGAEDSKSDQTGQPNS
jgi:hypothetical protein